VIINPNKLQATINEDSHQNKTNTAYVVSNAARYVTITPKFHSLAMKAMQLSKICQ